MCSGGRSQTFVSTTALVPRRSQNKLMPPLVSIYIYIHPQKTLKKASYLENSVVLANAEFNNWIQLNQTGPKSTTRYIGFNCMYNITC